MTIKELDRKLIETYTIKNLNYISLTLINIFKNQQYYVLLKISEIKNDNVNIKVTDDGKGFSKFMMADHSPPASLSRSVVQWGIGMTCGQMFMAPARKSPILWLAIRHITLLAGVLRGMQFAYITM